MKSVYQLSVILLVAFSVQWGSAQSSWTYTEFAKVVNGSGTLFKLEYGIKKNGYNGYVKWRITNLSNQPVYNVSIADKNYKLSSGAIVKRSGENITSVLQPGESKTTMADAVNSDENHGSWSDKNDNPVTYLEVATPMIRFAFERYGNKVGWNTVGSVRM